MCVECALAFRIAKYGQRNMVGAARRGALFEDMVHLMNTVYFLSMY